ncbi:MAG: NADH-quinone oxidoreductase subunit NuoH [Anaerolineaceae bacterium]
MNFWIDPVNVLIHWLVGILTSWGVESQFASLLVNFLGVAVYCTLILVFVFFLIWLERKLIARMQDRLGPNRVGPWGILQSIPDALKIFTKEYITPVGVDKIVYNLAPIIVVASVILVWAVVPMAPHWFAADLNVAVLYIVAVGELGILMIMMAGWSSNNKFALLGAFRTAAQLVSYEIPMVLAMLIPVFLSRSMSLNHIIQSQNIWFIILAPVAFIIYFLCSLAEVGRAPFDLLEAESEIVAGFHIEYSGLKFGMFYVGDFLHAFTISVLGALLFFGGWRGPGAEQFPLLGLLYMILKTIFVYMLMMLVRGTLPRLRIDQMMDFTWKVMTPLMMCLLVGVIIVDRVTFGAAVWLRVGAFLALNLVCGYVTLLLLGKYSLPKPKEFSMENANES